MPLAVSLVWSLLGDLLLACDRYALALTGTSVRVCSLAPDRKAATMPQALVATDLDLALDVLCDLATKVALDLVVRLDVLADAKNLSIREITDLDVVVDVL
jgi:hypothetical protein